MQHSRWETAHFRVSFLNSARRGVLGLLLVAISLLAAIQPSLGKDLVRRNFVLDQILISDGEEQIFDYYDLDGGAYLTLSLWHRDRQILATFSIAGIQGSAWKLSGAYLVKNGKLSPVQSSLALTTVKKPGKPESSRTQLTGKVTIGDEQIVINEEHFTERKFQVDYAKPRSIWDRWQLERNLRKTLGLPDLSVPLFK